MGSDLKLKVGDWALEVSVKDSWVQVAIVTDDQPPKTHYMRLTHAQAEELQEYLYCNMPIRQ